MSAQAIGIMEVLLPKENVEPFKPFEYATQDDDDEEECELD